MAKAIGLLVFVCAIWAAFEVTTEGINGAFGGVFASADAPTNSPAESLFKAERAGAAVERAHQEREARLDKLLAE